MIQEPPSKTWIVLITTIITTAGVICVAIIGLGMPFAQKMADNYFNTPEPSYIIVTAESPSVNSKPAAIAPTQQKPINTPMPPNSSDQTVSCVHPETLAQQKEWENPWLVDKVYGGYNVTVPATTELPSLWEANQFNSSNQIIAQIHQHDSNRTMSAGTWIIYTPCGCREIFGFGGC